MRLRGTSVSWARLAAALLFIGALQARAAAPADAAAREWPTGGWNVSTPEAEGMDSAALARLVELGAKNDMDSLLVTRHGRIVAEAYYAPYRAGLRHTVNSVTKAVTASLVGIAIDEGKLSGVDARVLDFFPGKAVANVDGNKKALAVGHLLDMNSGIDWKEGLDDSLPLSVVQMERAADWAGFILDRPMAQAPGAAFYYDSGNTHLLSAILSRTTGGNAFAYAKERLFKPLGITDVRWRQDPQGVSIGGYGLYLRPRDMAKIGYLYLNRGRWDGQQVLPQAWTDRVFNASIDMKLGPPGTFRYGSGWWTVPAKRAFMAVGLNRQIILVLPDIDVVAVVTGQRGYPFSPLIDQVSAAATSSTPLPDDATARQALAARIRDAATEKPTPVGPAPAIAAEISGKPWRFAKNPLGVKSLRLDLAAATPRYEVVFESLRPGAAERTVSGPIGLDGYFRFNDQVPESDFAVKGGWSGADTFTIVSRALVNGDIATYRLKFSGRTVDVAFSNNLGFKAEARGEAAE